MNPDWKYALFSPATREMLMIRRPRHVNPAVRVGVIAITAFYAVSVSAVFLFLAHHLYFSEVAAWYVKLSAIAIAVCGLLFGVSYARHARERYIARTDVTRSALLYFALLPLECLLAIFTIGY